MQPVRLPCYRPRVFRPVGDRFHEEYRLEARFPWSVLGAKPSAGAKIGLDVHVNDNDAGQRDTKLAWRDTSDTAYDNPQAFGNAELAGLIGWWNARWLGSPQRVVVPYAHALGRLPAVRPSLLDSRAHRAGRGRGLRHGPALLRPAGGGPLGTAGGGSEQSTIDQMRLINALCRFAEIAGEQLQTSS